jgi:hypothetical protein
MKTKASIVVMSHLSDVQEHRFVDSQVNNHINFAKYIILQCDGNLNQEIDTDVLWNEFTESRFYQK